MGLIAKIVPGTRPHSRSADSQSGEVQRLRDEVSRLQARLRELEALANTDPLVQLANRRSFEAALEGVLSRVERYGESASMIFVDVDGLKRINDNLGHKAGDEALVAIAQILDRSVRKSDFVARLSGDEFAILMSHADELTAWNMGLRIVESAINADFAYAGQKVMLSVAVGVAQIQPGDTPEAVVSRADQAMYAVKAA